MDQSVINGYVSDSEYLIQSFESIDSSIFLSPISEYIPDKPSYIADIGAGTGRDSEWLASFGHNVLAVEPVDEFRSVGRVLHHTKKIEWINDHLPSLYSIRKRSERFDFVLLASVWQHVNNEDRKRSLDTLREIVKERGRVVISLRKGPGAQKRKCYPVDVSDMVSLIRERNFKLLFSTEVPSMQKSNQNAGVTWTWLVVEAI